MADEVVSSARGRGKTQGNIPLAALPFTHLSVPNAEQYRRLLRVFARAKGRFIVHLRPEDTAAELRIDADEQLTEALDQLVKWGNLRADVDTSRVTTVEDFHRKRSHRKTIDLRPIQLRSILHRPRDRCIPRGYPPVSLRDKSAANVD